MAVRAFPINTPFRMGLWAEFRLIGLEADAIPNIIINREIADRFKSLPAFGKVVFYIGNEVVYCMVKSYHKCEFDVDHVILEAEFPQKFSGEYSWDSIEFYLKKLHRYWRGDKTK